MFMNSSSYNDANAAPVDAWNGYEGTHWASHADRYDAVNHGFDQPLLEAAAIRPGERVLDVGCGNGQLTRLAATAAAPGQAVGIDLSEPMLTTAVARSAAAGSRSAPVDYVRGDAEVHPFEAGSLDVVLSRFGVMFFADPVAAFTNLARALRPGGRLAFVCLRSLADDDLGTVLGALAAYLPADAGEGAAISLVDPARIEAVLSEAGFVEVRVDPVGAEQVWGRNAPDASAFLAAWGPVRHQLSRVDRARADAATVALTEAFRRFERDGAVRLRSSAWLVTAVTPAAAVP